MLTLTSQEALAKLHAEQTHYEGCNNEHPTARSQIFSLWKFSKINTPALFKFIPLTKYNHINHILLYQSTQIFFYIKEPIKSALKLIIQAMKNFVLDSNIHCTRRPANHVFLSLGRGCVFLKISRG